eukprot:79525_1
MSKRTATLSVSEILWRQTQPAWMIQSSKLSMILTQNGLNIASVSLLDDPDNINPFWIPHWEWSDPSDVPHMNVTGIKKELYGNHQESQLLSNICGHNICIDRFGTQKSTDIPRTCHGEGPISLFKLLPPKTKNGSNKVTFSTSLDIAGLDINRTFEFNDNNNGITVSTSIYNTKYEYSKIDRKDVEWCEHVTIGDPFLNGAVFHADCDNIYNFGADMPYSRFNEYDPLQKLPVSIDDVLSMPLIDDNSQLIEECICLRAKDIDDMGDDEIATITAINKDLGFQLKYSFHTRVFPWIAVWTEHFARKHAPWNGKERTRGMEFSTKPLPMPELETQSAFEGRIQDIDGKKIFEDKSIEFVLPPQGRTETFTLQWNRL